MAPKARTAVSAGMLLLAVTTPSLEAQVSAQGAVLFERYSFDSGWSFANVSELSLPFSVSYPLGNAARFTFSSGYTRIVLSPTAQGSDEIVVSGLTDSEARLTVDVLRDRLSLLVTGRIPTGMDGLGVDQGAVLGVLATDVLGFSTRSLGSGGSVGVGFSGAIPAGRMGIGLAGTVTRAGTFTPVEGVGQELRPGTEFRLRAGVEGPLGETAYLRAAAILARRSDDEVNGQALGVGTRISGYVSLDQRVGRSVLTFYAFDQLRADPQVENTALGGGVLPKGNLFAAGAQMDIPVRRRLRATPRIEFRRADQALDLLQSDLVELGTSFRFGGDVRYRIRPLVDIVVEASGLVGNVVDASNDVGANGYRFGASVQLGR